MRLSLILSTICLFLMGCSNNTSFGPRIGEGNGVCNDNTNITPFELGEEGNAPVSLETLTSSGSLKTNSVRITYEGKTLRKGKKKSTLVLGAVESPADTETEALVSTFRKLCAKGFTPELAAEEPVFIRVPISKDQNGKLIYNTYSFDFGPQHDTYLVLDGISSENPNFIDPFSEEPLTDFSDLINTENSNVYIEKREGKIPDQFNDENAQKQYIVTYQDPDSRLRFHLRVTWSPNKED